MSFRGRCALNFDIDLQSPESPPADLIDGNLHGKAEPGHLFAEALRIGAEIQEGAEHHVSAETG
jgi:hypothetical protein